MGLTCAQFSREINTDSPKQSEVWGLEDISLVLFLSGLTHTAANHSSSFGAAEGIIHLLWAE